MSSAQSFYMPDRVEQASLSMVNPVSGTVGQLRPGASRPSQRKCVESGANQTAWPDASNRSPI